MGGTTGRDERQKVWAHGGGQRSGKRFAAGDPGEAALCVVTARDVKTEGRKMFLRAELASCDGQVVFADAESLYVQPRKK